MDQVLLTLPIDEIAKVCLTNKEYANYCQNENFWSALYRRDFGIIGYIPPSWKIAYLQKIYPPPKIYGFTTQQSIKQQIGSFFTTKLLGESLGTKFTKNYLSQLVKRDLGRLVLQDFGINENSYFLTQDGILLKGNGPEGFPKPVEIVLTFVATGIQHYRTTAAGNYEVHRYQPPPQFVQISVGPNSMLCLDDQGRMYGEGDNLLGQLGIPYRYGIRNGRITSSGEQILARVQKYNFLVEVAAIPPMKRVISGVRNGFAIDFDNQVWGFGYSGEGQLGYISNVNYDPKRIDFEEDVLVKDVFAGWACTFFLDTDGKIWGCGDNRTNSLGLPERQIYPMTYIPELQNVRKIRASTHLTLVLTDDGQVTVFGADLYRMLGSRETQGLFYFGPDYSESSFIIRDDPTDLPKTLNLNSQYGIVKIVDIETSLDSYALLDDDHGLWVFGIRAKRHFDLDLSEGNIMVPERIPGVYPSAIRNSHDGIYVLANQLISVTREFVESSPSLFVRIGQNTADDAEGRVYLIT